MTPEITYFGKVNESGELKIHNRKSFLNDLRMLSGKDVTIIVKKKRKSRSINQNAYYWGVVIPILKDGLIDVGYKVDKEQTHLLMKSKFRIIELVNEQSGEIIKSIGSTTNMTTSEMMDYFAEIKQWAAEYLNVYVPDPNEQIKIELK